MVDFLKFIGYLINNSAGIELLIWLLYSTLFGIGFKVPAFYLTKTFREKPEVKEKGHFVSLANLSSYKRAYGYFIALVLLVFLLFVATQAKFLNQFISLPFLLLLMSIVCTMLWIFYYRKIRKNEKFMGRQGEHRQKQRWDRAVEIVAQTMGISSLQTQVLYYQTPTAFIAKNSLKADILYITQGMLVVLNDEELRAVAAHELVLYRSGILSFRRSLKWMIGIIFIVGVLSIILYALPVLSLDSDLFMGGLVLLPMVIFVFGVFTEFLVYMLIAQETYTADIESVNFTRYPEGLRSALAKTLDESDKFDNLSEVSQDLLFTPEAGWFFRNPPYQPKTEDRINLIEEVYNITSKELLPNEILEFNCPDCGSQMKPREYVSRYGVDSECRCCEKCGKFWFTANQLALIPDEGWNIQSFSEIKVENEQSNQRLQKCPLCGIYLTKTDFGYNYYRPWTCNSCEGMSLSESELAEFLYIRKHLKPNPFKIEFSLNKFKKPD